MLRLIAVSNDYNEKQILLFYNNIVDINIYYFIGKQLYIFVNEKKYYTLYLTLIFKKKVDFNNI